VKIKMRTLTFALLCLLLPPGVGRAADPFYTDLGKRLAAQGLPTLAPTTGDTEEAVLSTFEFVHLSGMANTDEVALTGLPFTRGLRLQSQSAPDQAWQHLTYKDRQLSFQITPARKSIWFAIAKPGG
jgi:hypothetical protein